jgi:formylglycine-generating enzyme required for sulfatase activity
MRALLQLVALWVAAALAACSVKPATFMQGDGQLADASQLPDASQISDAQSSDAVASAPAPSCVGLPMTCGANGNDSCCNSPAVPGGTYYRSFDLAGDANSGNTSFPAAVSNFRLDKYKVTVGRFRAFVNSGMGTQSSSPLPGAGAHPKISGSGWDTSWNASLAVDKVALVAVVKCNLTFQTWTDAPGTNENRPMNCITWYEAMAFCAWDGGYLATEAEWNYAATGGDQQRAYPWSSPAGSLTPLDGLHASYSDGTNCLGDGMPGCAVTDLVAVGTKPAGDARWGQSDLAGNVYDWTLDWYGNYAGMCADCANLTAATYRILRGGGFSVTATYLRASLRSLDPPTYRDSIIGVRCARSTP